MSQPGPKTGVPIAAIKTPNHSKPDQDAVAGLAASIREVGLLCPPTVDHVDGGGYILVAGRRRLAACYSLGWERMPVHIRDRENAYQDPGVAGQRYRAEHKDLLRELATLDENLIREHMTPAQRAEATAKRQVVWEAIHPSATAGAKRAEGGKTAGRGRPKGPLERSGANSPSFVNDTASKTGRSAASVRRDAQIGRALAESPGAAEVVHSAPKPIAQSELLAIAQAPRGERKAAAEKAVAKATAPKARRALHPNVIAKSTKAKPSALEQVVQEIDSWAEGSEGEEEAKPDPTLTRAAAVSGVVPEIHSARDVATNTLQSMTDDDRDALLGELGYRRKGAVTWDEIKEMARRLPTVFGEMTADDRAGVLLDFGAVSLDAVSSLRADRVGMPGYRQFQSIDAGARKMMGTSEGRRIELFVLAGGEEALALLGLDYTVTAEKLAAAYKPLALAAHPDREGGNAEVMARINQAQAIVRDFVEATP